MSIEVAERVDNERWDELASSAPAANLFYSAKWQEARRKYLRSRPYYLTLKEDGKVRAISTIESVIPGHNRIFGMPLGRLIVAFAIRRWPIFRMRDWVFLDPAFSATAAADDIARKTDEALRRLMPLTAEISGDAFQDPNPAYENGMALAGFEGREWATFIIGLKGNIDDIWKGMRNSARKAIRKAQDQALKVSRVADMDELKKYYSFFARARKDMKLWVPPFIEFKTLWEDLRGARTVLEIFMAKESGRIVGGMGVWGFNGIINEFGAVRSTYAARRDLYVGDIIKWEIIKWGNAMGFRYYDLEGVSPNPQEKEVFIKQFKEKWGGELKKYGIFRKSYRKAAKG